MFEQMLMPLDRQYDDGMAATGNAFQQAAEKLNEHADGGASLS